MDPTRLVIVDDHAKFVEMLTSLVASTESIDVVATAPNGQEAIRVAAETQPDVILMDLHMPVMNGIETTQQISSTSPHISILVLTMLDDDDSVFSAMRAGAAGYILKGARKAEIIHAIEAVRAGEVIFGPGIARRVMGFFRGQAQHVAVDPAAAFPRLTERELELLELIAAGFDNSRIARDLHLSDKTVRNHISNIFAKLHVAHRAEAIVMAREAGLGTGDHSSGQGPRPSRG